MSRCPDRLLRVTTTNTRGPAPASAAPTTTSLGRAIVRVLTTTDHKVIGKLYLVTSFGLFLVGGLMAMVIRSELAFPGQQIVNDELYNQLFTMHGTIMLLLFATPLFFGFAQRDHAVADRVAGCGVPAAEHVQLLAVPVRRVDRGVGVPDAAGARRTSAGRRTRRSRTRCARRVSGGDLWVMGLWMAGLGTILGAVNFVTTIICMRAPGMTMFRMPIFVLEHRWSRSLLVLIAFPILAGALLMLEADRALGAHVFDAGRTVARSCGSTCSGSSGIPRSTSSRCRSSASSPRSCRCSAASRSSATSAWSPRRSAIAALSVAVWAHHMFVTGAVNLPFFSFMTFLIAVPTGVKFFNWIGTMWGGSLSFDTPMLWSVGFLVTFLFGGLTGVILASPAAGLPVSDSYFVVAHFHYVVFGTVVFAMFAGFYFWWPKMTGRMLDERLGKVHFWLLFIGFHTTFLVQHWLGVEGMPRRYARLPARATGSPR